MSDDTRTRLPWTRSLKTRLIVLLTIAVLPLGLIAVAQTMSVINNGERLAERDILARTARAAGEQERVLRRAFGAASGLGVMAAELGSDAPECSAIMERFVDDREVFVFAGYIPADGVMRCSSEAVVLDISASPGFTRALSAMRPTVEVNRVGPASGQPVLVASVPVVDPETGDVLGIQSISILQRLSAVLLQAEVDDVDLALVDQTGRILATSTGLEDTDRFDRLGIEPRSMDIGRNGLLVRTVAADGRRQPVAVVRMIADEIYVVGLWAQTAAPNQMTFIGTTTPIFPVLMWITSLIVAYLAVNRLVLAPLARLGLQMAAFSFSRPDHSIAWLDDAPLEIRRIAETYNKMVARVVSDHATLEDSVAEKELLLREVHHRVKNNLQLISSILSMQMRSLKSDDARRILRRVQDRVMSLSTIHKALYGVDGIDLVRVDTLLEEIIASSLNIGLVGADGVETHVALGPVTLDADQAVPLTLLVTEALSNATKYIGRPAVGAAEIRIDLHQDANDCVHLVIFNTRGVRLRDELGIDGSGLGARLIEAFASQLGCKAKVEETEASYALQVSFEKLVTVQDEG